MKPTLLSKLHLISLPCLLATSFVGPVFADGDDEEEDHDLISNQAIVELVPGANIDELNADYGTTTLGLIPGHLIYLLQLPDFWDEHQFEDLIEEDPRVEEADLNYLTESAGGQTESFYFFVPPDNYYAQYSRNLLQLDSAHQVSTGTGIVVALLDTGVDAEHDVLAEMILPNGYNFVDDNTDTSDVGNDIDDDNDGFVDELVGHGTFMAGIIAMVAPDANLLIAKILDSDGRSGSFRIAQGIYYAVDQGAHVISLSLAIDVYEEEHEFLEKALEYANEANVVVVAAGGNLNQLNPDILPATDDHVIGVAGTDENDVKSEFSNYGDEEDYISISAPGTAIVSTVPGNDYGQWDGTSMSAALVSAAAALIKANDTDASAGQIKEILEDSAMNIDDANPLFIGMLGAGRLDIASALDAKIIDPYDLDQDGSVGVSDLLILFSNWGPCDNCNLCPSDLDNNCEVGVSDLLLLFANWG